MSYNSTLYRQSGVAAVGALPTISPNDAGNTRFSSGMSDYASNFWMSISQVPSYVLQHWPMWFGFAVTDYVGGMVAMALPRSGGVSGMIIRSAAMGGLKTADFGTFKAFEGM